MGDSSYSGSAALINGHGHDRPPRSDFLSNDSSKGWIVQKFGGTSVGKVPAQIADGIVSRYLVDNRIVVVCSARSSDTKLAGTTNL